MEAGYCQGARAGLKNALALPGVPFGKSIRLGFGQHETWESKLA